MAQYILSKTLHDKTARIAVVRIPHPALNDVYTNVYFKDYATAIIDESILPDMSYQESFCDFDSKGNIKIDLDVARKVKLKEIRDARNKQLRLLDKESEKAYDEKDTVKMKEIEEQKKELRDLPKSVDLSKATSINDLQEIWPEGLTK